MPNWRPTGIQYFASAKSANHGPSEGYCGAVMPREPAPWCPRGGEAVRHKQRCCQRSTRPAGMPGRGASGTRVAALL